MEHEQRSSVDSVPEDVLAKWQTTVNLLAELMDVPAALIMRLVEDDIEVFLSNEGGSSPYTVGALMRSWPEPAPNTATAVAIAGTTVHLTAW